MKTIVVRRQNFEGTPGAWVELPDWTADAVIAAHLLLDSEPFVLDVPAGARLKWIFKYPDAAGPIKFPGSVGVKLVRK